jgi:methylmalonyl-CoA mutase cobalamin-binding subunit
MFNRILAWLTPPRRKAIYNAGVAVFTLLIVGGFIAPDEVERFKEALVAVGGIYALLTNILASKNVNLDE